MRILFIILLFILLTIYFATKDSGSKYKESDCLFYKSKYMKVHKVGEDSYVVCHYDNPNKCMLVTKNDIETTAEKVDCLNTLYDNMKE